MKRHGLRGQWRVLALLAGVAMTGVSAAQTAAQPLRQEYFVQQAADEALLVKISAFEAEFESRLSGQNGETLLVSAIAGSRIAPVFQYVGAVKSARQLGIELISEQHTGRSEFGLEVARLKVWDERSDSVAYAYQLLSFGMQGGAAGGEANWTVKIDSLVNAGRIFRQFGMKEMRLWSDYLAAHLIHFHLHDFSIVYAMTREVLAEVRGARLQNIELAALQLQAAALTGLKQAGSLPLTGTGADPVQAVLARSASLAESMGFGFEQAWALKASGDEYTADGLDADALRQYQQALAIADSIEDAAFATDIRERLAKLYALQGDSSSSGEVLQQIETRLLAEQEGDELALNLLAQGRLLMARYRYRQAVEVLLQALRHQNHSAIRSQVNFELARAFYHSGRPEEAMARLQSAGVGPSAEAAPAANPVIDVGEGLRIMANLYRAGGDYALMREARTAQARYAPSEGWYRYEQGLDELAQRSAGEGKAGLFFGQSQAAALAAGQTALQHTARLQLCALEKVPADAPAWCAPAGVATARDWLLEHAGPDLAGEALYLSARMLARDGRPAEAARVMERLLDEVLFLRSSLPGVLGAWYHERHAELFAFQLDLLSGPPGRPGSAHGAASLLALSKIRLIESLPEPAPGDDAEADGSDPLRSALARLAGLGRGRDATDPEERLPVGMAELRARFEGRVGYLSAAGLDAHLRGLGKDETLLTYHLSASRAQAWVARRGLVERRDLGDPLRLYRALQKAQQDLAGMGAAFPGTMDELGERLVGPVADLLGETVYWIPAGPLLGFPLDALRLRGKYLAETHIVVNQAVFPAPAAAGGRPRAGSLQNVFLAGHPQDFTAEVAARLDTSAEISAIADLFVGPGLDIVQGAALLPDEFRDGKFQRAGLVHLSMPGWIDLRYPEQSGLELSGTDFGSERALLTPADIRGLPLQARLVFFSALRLKDRPVSGFSSRTALVADCIDAGAQFVVAFLWPGGGHADQGFMLDFYRRLARSGDVAQALTDTKRAYLADRHTRSLNDWAGYQVFSR